MTKGSKPGKVGEGRGKGCPWDPDAQEATGGIERGFGERTFAAVATADARSRGEGEHGSFKTGAMEPGRNIGTERRCPDGMWLLESYL